MSAPEAPSVVLEDFPLEGSMKEPVRALLADGFRVYVYARPRLRGGGFVQVSWVIIEREGNVGVVGYDRIDGYRVTFSIEPSAATGSGLLVGVPRPGRDDREPKDVEEILVCARLATGLTYKNFATSKALPNHGWAHFSWGAKHLVELVA